MNTCMEAKAGQHSLYGILTTASRAPYKYKDARAGRQFTIQRCACTTAARSSQRERSGGNVLVQAAPENAFSAGQGA